MAIGDPPMHACCERLCALVEELQGDLRPPWVPNPTDAAVLAETLRAVNGLQAALTEILHGKPAPTDAPTDGDPADRPSSAEWCAVDPHVGSSPDSPPAPAESPLIPKTPTMPQSAHDVVWCANKGAAPLEPVAVIPKKPKHYSEEWGGLDEMRPDDKHYDVYHGVTELFAHQRALVKTIKNDACDPIIDRLKSCAADDTTFRTSTSLLPPHGRNMRMFGSERQYSAGLVWDRTTINLSKSWAWPSGYYAKTEFNVDSSGRLKNGREEALVTVEQLMAANEAFTAVHAFNEIYADVGCATLVAVFSRTYRYDHLLHALALQTAMFEILGRWIPAFVIDPINGVKPFPRRMQQRFIQSFLEEVEPTADAIIMKPFSPVDVIRKSYENFSAEQVVQFHGAYGVTESCLDLIFNNKDVHELMRWVITGLSYASHADNVVAARLLVTRAGPIAIKHPETLRLDQVQPIMQNVRAEAMLPLVGVFVVFATVSNGDMQRRLKEALATLKLWLEQSDSLSFRMASWRGMKNHPDSKMLPFVGNQAVMNRTKFYDALLKLEKSHGVLHCLVQLSVIVSGLHHPCLRLDLLQYILGLDTRYHAVCLRETIDLALRCAVATG